MLTLSQDEFKKKYGSAGLQVFQPDTQAQSEKTGESYFKRVTDSVGTDIADRSAKVDQILQRDTNPITKGVQVFGQGAGMAANTLEKTVTEIPGVKRGLGVVGSGFSAVANLPPFKSISDELSNSKRLQELITLYGSDQNFKDSVDAVANIARLAGDVEGVTKAATGVTEKTLATGKMAAQNITDAVDTTVTKGKELAGTAVDKVANPNSIMQRVARIPKGAQAKFEKMAGESVGEYLNKRDIYGNTEEILTKLYDRFSASRNAADEAIAKLSGEFKAKPVETALNELFARETRISSPGALSSDFKRVRELRNKYQKSGLNMSEINEVKRLYERNVRLDYVKSNLPEGVARSTTIDSALRDWQFGQAEKLGLKNLPEINKETRLAKQLLDDLGRENAGIQGNNAIPLSDVILLSSGDPKVVSLYITKKILGSKRVGSKISQYLYKGEKTGAPKAQFGEPKKGLQEFMSK